LRKPQRRTPASVERERKAREQAQRIFQIARQTVKDLLAEVASKKPESGPVHGPGAAKTARKGRRLAASVFYNRRATTVVQARTWPRDRRYGEIYEMLGDKMQAELLLNECDANGTANSRREPGGAGTPPQRGDGRDESGNFTPDKRARRREAIFDQAFAQMKALADEAPAAPQYRTNWSASGSTRGHVREIGAAGSGREPTCADKRPLA